jgi:TPR repeat protein
MAHKVFICHSSSDKAVADAACAALEAQRIPCWIAPRDILAGEEYGESIIEAIGECQIMLLVFSAQANNSPQVRREIERGVSKAKIIVPFRIEDIMPSRAMEFALSNTHWLDALTPPMESYLLQLCDTISRLIQKHAPGEAPLWRAPDAVPGPQIVEPVFKPQPVLKAEPAVRPEPPSKPSMAHEAAAGAHGVIQEPIQQRTAPNLGIFSNAEGKKVEAETQKSVWSKVPVWGWVVVPLCLVAVFALGRLLPPSLPPQQQQHTSPQAASPPVPTSTAPPTPTASAPTANPAPSDSSAPPVPKQTPAATLPSATAPRTASARPSPAPKLQPVPAGSSDPPAAKSSSAEINQKANEFVDQQRYTEAAPLFAQACAGGNASACDKLGKMAQSGRGTAQNQSQATGLYTRACDENFGEGCRDLAMLYSIGTGVPQDLSKAASLLTKACSVGVIGCNNLGLFYANGQGVAQNFLHAAALYSKACSGGVAIGCTNLAFLYANGQGVPQSYPMATTFFSKACDGGEATGCRALGFAYAQGLGVQKDLSKARQFLTKGCRMGDPKACDKLKQVQ